MNRLITIAASLLVILLTGISCDNMNDIQSEYASREEIVYLGKVDSLKAFPGFGRAKITWYVSADPKIEKTVIYWNMRKDSLVRDFVRTTPGIQKDSIIIENMDETSVLYEFRNINRKGESSLFSSITVSAWGGNFAANLLARKLVSKEFDYDLSQYTLQLTDAVKGDSVAYSQVNYADKNGIDKTVRIDRNTSIVVLPDFADGAEFQFRNVFFLPQGMDTVYSVYQTYTAPTATLETGTKLALAGNANSRYFQRDGKILYEWNNQGDLIEYALNEDGSFSLTNTYPALASRSTYRAFFFHDDDKFITITANNDALVQMWRFANGQLTLVPTPTGGISFGSGFRMAGFFPGKGLFYSYDKGALRVWIANNNATWSTSGPTVANDEKMFSPSTRSIVYNTRHILSVDANGYLWSIPISTSGTLLGKNKIGSGWDRFVQLVGVGSKLLALDTNGDIYEFDFDPENKYWIVD